jgi:large subunit ribosomal protein L4
VSPTAAFDLDAASPAEVRRFLRPEPTQHTVDRRSMDGAVLGQVDLDPGWFGIQPNLAVLHQVVTAQLAAARSGTQSTKTRSEVRGGGAKPFRQKGTGRARQGSTRSPQWIGGGVALGPKPRSYAQKTPKKMIQLALRSALSDRASQGRVALIDAWTFEVPKTKRAIEALKTLGLTGRILVVLDTEDGIADRSFGNVPDIQTIMVTELNSYDILVNDWVVFTDATLPGGSAADDPGSTADAPAEAAPAAAAAAAAPASSAEAAAAAAAAPASSAEAAAAPTDTASTDTDTEGSAS